MFLRVAAHQHEAGAQFLHQVELALGAGQGALAQRVGHAFEIPEGLEEGDLQPQVAHDAADVCGGAVEGQQIMLEQFDAVEAGGRGGFQFLGQRARQRHGGDRFAEGKGRGRHAQAPSEFVPQPRHHAQPAAVAEQGRGEAGL